MPIANLVIPALKTDGLRIFSAADSPTLHTHDKPENPACPPPPDKCSKDFSFCFEVAPSHSCYTVSPIESKANVPFWIMNVDSNLIDGHNGIWSPGVQAMVAAVAAQNEHFNRMRADPAFNRKLPNPAPPQP
jgi:hypothetical protein